MPWLLPVLLPALAILAAAPSAGMTIPVGEAQVLSLDENGFPTPLGDSWRQLSTGGFIPTWMLLPGGVDREVRILLSDGTEEIFELELTPSSQTLIPIQFTTASFAPQPGTLGTLVNLGQDPSSMFVTGPDDAKQLWDRHGFEVFDPLQYLYTLDGQSHVLDAFAIPEPSTFVLVGAGLVLFAGRRRRGRQQ